jgi:hypothetical protein
MQSVSGFQSGEFPCRRLKKAIRKIRNRRRTKKQSEANVSAYKAAQGQGKPASSPFAKKT